MKKAKINFNDLLAHNVLDTKKLKRKVAVKVNSNVTKKPTKQSAKKEVKLNSAVSAEIDKLLKQESLNGAMYKQVAQVCRDNLPTLDKPSVVAELDGALKRKTIADYEKATNIDFGVLDAKYKKKVFSIAKGGKRERLLADLPELANTSFTLLNFSRIRKNLLTELNLIEKKEVEPKAPTLDALVEKFRTNLDKALENDLCSKVEQDKILEFQAKFNSTFK